VKAPDPERLRIVVHEVRSPVAALDALATAAATTDDPELIRRMVDLGVAAARDVARLVSDPELVSLRLDHVDLAALAATFARPDVSVEIDGPATVDGDATRLRQVLSNLVANALRSGGSIVQIGVDRTAQGTEISVRDDGAGIAPELLPRVFERFVRGPDSAGSGLGLAIVADILAAHGGSASAASTPGEGTTVTLLLPGPGAATAR